MKTCEIKEAFGIAALKLSERPDPPYTKPVIDRVFPFAETREALKYLESAAHFGKIVITV